MKFWLVSGAISMALAVMLGAFGAHGLKSRLSAELLDVYYIGVQYHVYHALALLIIGVIAGFFPQATGVQWAGGLILAGIIVFSGSLYVLAVSGVRILGAVTPLGGVAFIAGWITLAISVWRASA